MLALRAMLALVPWVALQVADAQQWQLAGARDCGQPAICLLSAGKWSQPNGAFIMVAVALGALIIGRRALTPAAPSQLLRPSCLVLRPEAFDRGPGSPMSFAATTDWSRCSLPAQCQDFGWGQDGWLLRLRTVISSAVAGALTRTDRGCTFQPGRASMGFGCEPASVPFVGVL